MKEWFILLFVSLIIGVKPDCACNGLVTNVEQRQKACIIVLKNFQNDDEAEQACRLIGGHLIHPDMLTPNVIDYINQWKSDTTQHCAYIFNNSLTLSLNECNIPMDAACDMKMEQSDQCSSLMLCPEETSFSELSTSDTLVSESFTSSNDLFSYSTLSPYSLTFSKPTDLQIGETSEQSSFGPEATQFYMSTDTSQIIEESTESNTSTSASDTEATLKGESIEESTKSNMNSSTGDTEATPKEESIEESTENNMSTSGTDTDATPYWENIKESTENNMSTSGTDTDATTYWENIEESTESNSKTSGSATEATPNGESIEESTYINTITSGSDTEATPNRESLEESTESNTSTSGSVTEPTLNGESIEESTENNISTSRSDTEATSYWENIDEFTESDTKTSRSATETTPYWENIKESTESNISTSGRDTETTPNWENIEESTESDTKTSNSATETTPYWVNIEESTESNTSTSQRDNEAILNGESGEETTEGNTNTSEGATESTPEREGGEETTESNKKTSGGVNEATPQGENIEESTESNTKTSESATGATPEREGGEETTESNKKTSGGVTEATPQGGKIEESTESNTKTSESATGATPNGKSIEESTESHTSTFENVTRATPHEESIEESTESYTSTSGSHTKTTPHGEGIQESTKSNTNIIGKVTEKTKTSNSLPTTLYDISNTNNPHSSTKSEKNKVTIDNNQGINSKLTTLETYKTSSTSLFTSTETSLLITTTDNSKSNHSNRKCTSFEFHIFGICLDWRFLLLFCVLLIALNCLCWLFTILGCGEKKKNVSEAHLETAVKTNTGKTRRNSIFVIDQEMIAPLPVLPSHLLLPRISDNAALDIPPSAPTIEPTVDVATQTDFDFVSKVAPKKKRPAIEPALEDDVSLNIPYSPEHEVAPIGDLLMFEKNINPRAERKITNPHAKTYSGPATMFPSPPINKKNPSTNRFPSPPSARPVFSPRSVENETFERKLNSSDESNKISTPNSNNKHKDNMKNEDSVPRTAEKNRPFQTSINFPSPPNSRKQLQSSHPSFENMTSKIAQKEDFSFGSQTTASNLRPKSNFSAFSNQQPSDVRMKRAKGRLGGVVKAGNPSGEAPTGWKPWKIKTDTFGIP